MSAVLSGLVKESVERQEAKADVHAGAFAMLQRGAITAKRNGVSVIDLFKVALMGVAASTALGG